MDKAPYLREEMGHFLSVRLCGFEAGHVDREAVLNVGFDETLVGFVDLLDVDDFDVGGDVVFVAEVEHLLSFCDAANGRAGDGFAAEDEADGGKRQRLLGDADETEVAVAAEQLDEGVDVVVGGDAVENEVEATGVFARLVGVFEITTSSAPRRSASSTLFGEVVKTTVCAPSAFANLTPMWPRPPRPTMPTFLPVVTPQWWSGEYVVMPAQSSGAAASRSRFFGMERTKRSSTTMESE
jgi:hypothetical protein